MQEYKAPSPPLADIPSPRPGFAGDHTRSITVSTPTTASGGIMRFAKVRLSCLGCKAPLDQPAGQKGTPLCKHCLDK